MSDILLEFPLLNEPSNIMNPKIMLDKEKSNAQLWGEEIKCLFLRYRELLDEAIEDFVKEIFNYDLSDKGVKEELEIATITRLEVNEFISQKVIEQILDRYLKAYNVKAIKKFVNIMIDFKVPNRSGKNANIIRNFKLHSIRY
ncbi:9488_t:CDS:2 [Funneliformis geosporum]|nr:9488_t:CDS:2 [Funneliformis geosporum]